MKLFLMTAFVIKDVNNYICSVIVEKFIQNSVKVTRVFHHIFALMASLIGPLREWCRQSKNSLAPLRFNEC
jgi:hypothetical protein